MSKQLVLLKKRRFLPLFITQFFGAFNDNACKNAFLIWFTYDVALKNNINASFVVTIATALFILPFFLFSATAGQVADKYEKSWLTKQIKLIEIILMLLCSLFFYLETVNGLLFLVFCMGAQSAFFGPIKYSLLPEHLADDELVSGNGLVEAATFLSILFGTIFGGLIIRVENGVAILSFFLVSFAIIGWFSSSFIPKAKVRDKQLKISWNIFQQTKKIMVYAQTERTVWLSIIGISWFWFLGASFLTQFPIYTQRIIGGDEVIVTLFLTLFSIGVAIGSALCSKLLNNEINGRLVPLGSIGISLAILVFVSASMLYVKPTEIISILVFINSGVWAWLIILSLVLFAFFAGIYIVPLYAIMQHRSDETYLARIISANNVLNALFMVFSSVFALILFKLGLDLLQLFLSIAVINIFVFYVIRKIVKKRLENA